MKMFVGFFALMLSAVVMAESRIVSIDAFDMAYTGGLSFKHDNSKSRDRDVSTLRLNLNYAQELPQYPGLMWKAKVNINRENVDHGAADSFSSAYGAAGGVLYNVNPEDLKNSFMVSALAGLEYATYEYATASDDDSGINMFLEVEGGKRFDMGQYSVASISYAPTISVNLKRYGGDLRDHYFTNGSEIKLNFLKFDILF